MLVTVVLHNIHLTKNGQMSKHFLENMDILDGQFEV